MLSLIKKLWRHISRQRRRQFALLLVLIVFSSFTEVLSIGAIIPFLGALAAPDKIFAISGAREYFLLLNISKPQDLLFPLTIFFVSAALIAGMTRYLLLWVSTKVSFATGADLSVDIYRKTLYQPYQYHVDHNSSEIVSGILTKAKVLIGSVVMPIIHMISSALIITSVVVTLILIDPGMVLLIFTCFGGLYVVIAFIVRKRLSVNAKIFSSEQAKVLKLLQEGLGGIRDVLLDGSQQVFIRHYVETEHKLREAGATSNIISSSPKYLMETMGMVIMGLFAFFSLRIYGDIATVLPILGSIAMGAQRLLPVMQQGYQSWAYIRNSEGVLQDVIELLDKSVPEHANEETISRLNFIQAIEYKNISFRYHADTPWVLEKLNLRISKGARVGFVGETGSGKSTLIDLTMGLLIPNTGTIAIDTVEINDGNRKNWQANIAHVPQSIFLADSSIAENIALGVPVDKIDFAKVQRCAEQAHIHNHVLTLKEGYHTFVGERGVRLSGGQRQRIGIARALYKDATVIVFDEATSALDTETETAVMESIDSLSKDLTLLIVAHRHKTLEKCDLVVELKNGGISRMGTYKNLITSA